MNAKDQNKVIQQGVTIIRASSTLISSGGKPLHTNICIKAKTKARPEWFTLQKNFTTLTARDARMNALQLDPLTIVD